MINVEQTTLQELIDFFTSSEVLPPGWTVGKAIMLFGKLQKETKPTPNDTTAKPNNEESVT